MRTCLGLGDIRGQALSVMARRYDEGGTRASWLEWSSAVSGHCLSSIMLVVFCGPYHLFCDLAIIGKSDSMVCPSSLSVQGVLGIRAVSTALASELPGREQRCEGRWRWDDFLDYAPVWDKSDQQVEWRLRVEWPLLWAACRSSQVQLSNMTPGILITVSYISLDLLFKSAST